MEETPFRVLIVEDNDGFRETLELLFGMRDEVVVVGSASSGDDAPELARRVAPDVVLMDYRMPGLNGAGSWGAAEGEGLIQAACSDRHSSSWLFLRNRSTSSALETGTDPSRSSLQGNETFRLLAQ